MRASSFVPTMVPWQWFGRVGCGMSRDSVDCLICLDQTMKCEGIAFCPGTGSEEVRLQ